VGALVRGENVGYTGVGREVDGDKVTGQGVGPEICTGAPVTGLQVAYVGPEYVGKRVVGWDVWGEPVGATVSGETVLGDDDGLSVTGLVDGWWVSPVASGASVAGDCVVGAHVGACVPYIVSKHQHDHLSYQRVFVLAIHLSVALRVTPCFFSRNGLNTITTAPQTVPEPPIHRLTHR
jgi:hypothetical protein